MTTSPEFSSADLLLLRQQLADWRGRQPGRPRLPAAVWEAAAAIAQHQGPSRVARTLGLCYPRLRQWMGRGAAQRPAAATSARFIEVKCSPPVDAAPPAVGWAELRDGSGRVLRLHVGRDPAAWQALADSFWRQGR